ncbi:MAG TPA: BCAM0308 family protein [Usitatibacter sp.]|nr:BCAM0308 family protein [Usitatibacter sp.]
MKPLRATPRLVTRESLQDHQRAVGHGDDPYHGVQRPPEPTLCPTCKAVFMEGRWAWARKPDEYLEQNCPACQRIQDEFPAGYVTIKGEFIKQHRDEIIALMKSKEDQEKAEHPLQRIMAIEDVREGLQVTTTDSHLARGLGEALHEAYKGDLKLRYSRDENLLRATWKR